ncbi:hypothetical protein PCCS19_32440 [Paenibacillus sp. CCS19]|nr:hypothetical protein PCCS19_32440 [Paenibacillus cellulosilyticus]
MFLYDFLLELDMNALIEPSYLVSGEIGSLRGCKRTSSTKCGGMRWRTAFERWEWEAYSYGKAMVRYPN